MTDALDLDDVQAGALHERPSPYVGTYVLLRVNDPQDGRDLVSRLIPLLSPARSVLGRAALAWMTLAFTYQGLKALGVPQESLDSFAPEFRQGMAARAVELGDVGASGPDHWEKPLGSPDVHIALATLATDQASLDELVERARRAHDEFPGIDVIWRQDCYQLATGRTSFGFRDGIGNPAVAPIKAGEFILGYPDETGALPPMPTPDVLGRNGTYVVFRKLHTRVAAYRRYLRERSADRREETLLGADPKRRNDFGYRDDPRGLKCPAGAHARRANPRDALEDEHTVDVRLHRMIRRGTSYGPALPDGVLDDDGVDRGIIFVFAGAHPGRQFEFVKTQWLNDGIFIGAPQESDPLVGPRDGTGTFTVPRRPIRGRLQGIPPFVVTRGGEYCFAPGLRGLRWLADLTEESR